MITKTTQIREKVALTNCIEQTNIRNLKKKAKKKNILQKGHKFFFTPKDDPTKRLYTVSMNEYERVIHILNDKEIAKRTPEFEKERHAFLKEYMEKNGKPWKNYWPKPPITHFMYNITEIGQKINVVSNESYFVNCTDYGKNKYILCHFFSLSIFCLFFCFVFFYGICPTP